MGWEDESDAEMNEHELANHFKENAPKKKVVVEPKLETKEDIEAWEKAQDNSNDIYRISARVKNLARGADASLTPVGEALCNTYTHVLKELYDFAETVKNKKTKAKLLEILRKNEVMPGNFIAAVKNGVR